MSYRLACRPHCSAVCTLWVRWCHLQELHSISPFSWHRAAFWMLTCSAVDVGPQGVYQHAVPHQGSSMHHWSVSTMLLLLWIGKVLSSGGGPANCAFMRVRMAWG